MKDDFEIIETGMNLAGESHYATGDNILRTVYICTKDPVGLCHSV